MTTQLPPATDVPSAAGGTPAAAPQTARVRISVVTPSYNQVEFLGQTIGSVLAQREQIHEYIVIDGGSTDGSADLIRRYAEQGGIDYWHSRKDRGQADAIAQGFDRATGDVICWLNSDDVFLPAALAKVRAAFERHPDWEVLTAYHVRIDEHSRILHHHRIPAEGPRMARWGVHHVAQPGCFFRKSLYQRVGGISQELHCLLDTELWYRMFDAGAKWGHLPEYVAAFRIHPASKGQAWTEKYAAENAAMDRQYARYRRRRRHVLGRQLYRASQILRGRLLGAWRDDRRWAGKPLAEEFGPIARP